MIKCDECGKTSLLPERLGSVIICKKCLLKMNGIMWKYRQVTDGKDLEKRRKMAIDSARKAGFSNKTLLGMNEYFDQQKSSMSQCEACREIISSPQKLGKAILCQNCFSKVNITELKKTKYFDRKELNASKDKILKIAQENNFPSHAIDYINQCFDKKGGTGWLYTVDGGSGQILRVYEDHLIISTKDSFQENNMELEYIKLLGKEKSTMNGASGAKEIGSELLGELAHFRNPLSKKNMLKVAKNVAIKKMNTTSSQNQKTSINVRKGDRKVDYKDYDCISVRMPKKEESKGFVAISNSKAKENGANDILFFFNNTAVKKKIRIVIPIIEDYILNIHQKKGDIKAMSSISEQLRELKSLLDDGIITEKDFEDKKKQLLEL